MSSIISRRMQATPPTRLGSLPLHQGDIGRYYEGIWSHCGNDGNALRFLSFVSRLRIAFDAQWVRDEFVDSLLPKFQRDLVHLFSKDPDGYRFFHDSFRQFASEKTASLYGGDRPSRGRSVFASTPRATPQRVTATTLRSRGHVPLVASRSSRQGVGQCKTASVPSADQKPSITSARQAGHLTRRADRGRKWRRSQVA